MTTINQHYFYLYDLPKTVTKTQICELIKAKTGIQLLEREPQIKRDLIRPFYSAIISLPTSEQPDNLTKAAEKLRYFEVAGHPCRGLPFDNQLLGTNVQKIHENNLFVRKIPEKMTAPDLEDYFKGYGKIKSLKISLNADYTSRRYGFICFDEADFTKKALADTANAESIQGVPYKPRDSRQFRKVFNNIYVKNLPTEFKDEKKVRDLFEAYGRIESIKVESNDKGTFAFVCFGSEDKEDREYGPTCAAKAIEALHDKCLPGQTTKLYVREALKKTERAVERTRETLKYKNSKKRCNLYVKNFPENITKAQLEEIFSQNGGEIESCRLFASPTDPTQNLYAFVCFKTPDMALKAKQELGGRQIANSGKPLYINFYEIKEVRALQNEEAKDKQDYKMYQAEHAMNSLDNVNREEIMQKLYQLLAFMPQLNQQVRGAMPNYPRPHSGAPGGQRQPMQHNSANKPRPQQMSQRSQLPMGQYQQQRPMQSMPQQPQAGYPQQQPNMMQSPQSQEQIMYFTKTQHILPALSERNLQYKQQVGTVIFDFVVKNVGDQLAPKITGMLIDLPIPDIHQYLVQYETLVQRIKQAKQLLASQQNAA